MWVMLTFICALIISPTMWPMEPGPPLPKLKLPLAAATAAGRAFNVAGPDFGFAMIRTGAMPHGRPERRRRTWRRLQRQRRAKTGVGVAWSASAVGGIAPRAHQQRHVVVGRGVGNAEVDRHFVEKRRLGQRDAQALEIRG